MHPVQDKIQPAQGPREASSPEPSNVISSSGSKHVFLHPHIQEQIAIKRRSGTLLLLLLLFLADRSLGQSPPVNPPPQKIGLSCRLAALLRGKKIHMRTYPRNRVRRPQ